MTNVIESRAKRIKLLVMDVDGVLTDGRLGYTNSGDEIKFFDVTDGMGLALWARSGGKSAILTAKKSDLVKRRSKEMHIDGVYQGAESKLDVFNGILRDFNVASGEVCYIGDDLLDIPVLKRVGFAIGVRNAADEVKGVVHSVTVRGGGKGAVREVVNMILKIQGKWDGLLEEYLA